MAHSFASSVWHRMTGSFTGANFHGPQDLQRTTTPEVGDRYAQSTQGSPVWVVENVMEVASSTYPLVRLSRENHPDLMKIVSVSALADTQEFIRT